MVALVLASAWAVVSHTAEKDLDEGRRFQQRAARKGVRTDALGYIEYPIRAVAKLASPVESTAQSMLDWLSRSAGKTASLVRGDGLSSYTVAELVAKWRAAGARLGDFVRLSPSAALQVLSGRWVSLHAVALTQRVNRDRLLERSEPSRRALSAALAELAGSARRGASDATGPSTTIAARAPRWAGVLHSAEDVILWIQATQHLKDTKKTPEASDAFAAIFAKNVGVPVHLLKANLQMVHHELLRRARVRLDSVAMLLFRQVWQETLRAVGEDKVNIYVFADASPQWRGLELFAGTVDVYDGQAFLRRLLPMVSLDRAFMDTVGKALALLWQFWLMCGPGFQLLKSFCRRVRAITTDQGVERKIGQLPCILPEFYHLIDPAFDTPPVGEGEDLFPRALCMPGWMHLFDLILRGALSGMCWFPKWIEGLKSMVSFLRSATNMATLTRSLRQAGHGGAADLLQATKFAHFADWRWGTLRACCKALLGVVDTLRLRFDAKAFGSSRDTTGMKTMLEALRSDSWRRLLNFVHWVCVWLGDLMSWGQGCSCHEGSLMGGVTVHCDWKGRRLPDAHHHASEVLRRGLAEANAWTPEAWDVDQAMLAQMQSCVRGAYHLAMRKLEFLDRVPYLLASLGRPGVRDRCLEQWEKVAPQDHHKVSREFLDPRGRLRRYVDSMAPDGSGMAPELQQEVASLAAIPMDDTVVESPRVVAH